VDTSCDQAVTVNGALEQEIRELIVKALMLDDVRPEDIDVEAPLFVEGLGLDSIDALELALALEKQYGLKLGGDDRHNREIFGSVRTLAAHIEEQRAARPSSGSAGAR
jgi:acyl carrier protein